MATVGREVGPAVDRLLDEAARLLLGSGIFAGVDRKEGRVECAARGHAEAWFRIDVEGDRWFVSWNCAGRYMSQSIEADLMWTGDDLNDLIDEELADQGYSGKPLGRVEHFRDAEKHFVFRSAIPVDAGSADARTLTACVRAYEAAFRDLGDMKAGEE
jgi:hypothetical protein